MIESDKGQKTGQRAKKYLWFGYGNYSGLPNLQIGGGYVRDSGLFDGLLEESKTKRSAVPFFIYAILALLGCMGFAMLLAWVASRLL